MIFEATVAGIREVVGGWRAAGQTIALVPTMGNLHAGHMSLARLSRGLADKVVMSIFVNPTQFGEGEDFGAYPRTLDEDRATAVAGGTVDALFVPGDAEIYPYGLAETVRISMPAIKTELCGAYRPGHFDGVATVIARLLNIAQPDFLVLGYKDYQQLVLIERMVADMRWPVRVVGGAIERETDGLALSSRNRYLSLAERAIAPQLHRTLELTTRALRDGERDYLALAQKAEQRLREAGFKVDYVEIRDASTLERPNGRQDSSELVVLAAAWLGHARLIDNQRV